MNRAKVKRTEHINLRYRPCELAHLQKCAVERGYTLSQYLRLLTLGKAKPVKFVEVEK